MKFSFKMLAVLFLSFAFLSTPLLEGEAWAKKSKKTRKKKSKKAKNKKPKKSASGSQASAAEGGAPMRRDASGRQLIDFDERMISGQTRRAGGVYLFDRKKSNLNSLVKRRRDYRRELMLSIYE